MLYFKQFRRVITGHCPKCLPVVFEKITENCEHIYFWAVFENIYVFPGKLYKKKIALTCTFLFMKVSRQINDISPERIKYLLFFEKFAKHFSDWFTAKFTNLIIFMLAIRKVISYYFFTNQINVHFEKKN